MTKLSEYIKSKGLNMRSVCQDMGVSRQSFSQYGTGVRGMNANTYKKIAESMTRLGVPTKARDIMIAIADED